MKVVFIVNGYYPNYSTNGICVHKIVQSFKKQHEVHVLCKKDDTHLKTVEEIDSVVVHRFSDKEISFRNALSDRIKRSHGMGRALYRCLLFLLRLWFWAKPFFQRTTIKKELVVAIEESISSVGDIDVLVPCCFPMEALVAAYNIKKQNQSIFVEPLLFDKFTDNVACQKNAVNMFLKRKRHIKMEHELLGSFDRIIATNDWKMYLSKVHSDCFKKTEFIEIPSLAKPCSKGPGDGPFLYCGLINRRIRPVNKVLRVLSNPIFDGFHFEFLVKGDQANRAFKFAKKKKNFSAEVNVLFERCCYEAQHARGFVSIGNIDVSQTPSKIFEYISTGKPIVHFYYDENDRCISLLGKYGNGFCFNLLKYSSEDLLGLKKFLESSFAIDFDEAVYSKFIDADPAFVGQKLLRIKGA